MTTRRKFLSNSTAAVAGGLVAPWVVGGASNTCQSADGRDFVTRSQQLPSPSIVLPTDQLPPPTGRRQRIAAITTTYFKYSHADDIITKFIEGYSVVGRIHNPHCDIVTLFVDQFPDSDIGRGMAARYKIPVTRSATEALTLNHGELNVDGVLLIGEHGNYPLNAKGQREYPRRRLFAEIVDVFRRAGRAVPVFNDKHLSFSWDNAKWMYDQADALQFPMMAGSSVPVTWRLPPLSFRTGVPLESALVVGYGGFESYGFHCLEFLQSFVEHRSGGETGVKAVQALDQTAAAKAAERGEWPVDLLPAAIAPALDSPLATQPTRPFKFEDLRNSIVFRILYSDGFQGAVCLAGERWAEFSFAARVKDVAAPVATFAYLPKPQRDHFSFLCNHIEVMFRSGRASYPVERTLLVTGILDALHDSRAAGGTVVETPHLDQLRYIAAKA